MNKRQLEIKEFFNRAASTYDSDRSGDGRIFNELIEIPSTIKLVGHVEKNDRVLDIGCGIGFYSKYYGDLHARIIGIDISERMIEISKFKCRRVLEASFENTSLEEFSSSIRFDFIIGGFMLGYFDDLEESLGKIETLLAPNGIAVLSMLHPVRLSASNRTLFSYEVGEYFDEKYYKTDLNMKFGELSLRKWNVEDVSIAADKCNLSMEVREPIPKQTRSKKFDKNELNFYKANPSVIVFRFKKK